MNQKQQPLPESMEEPDFEFHAELPDSMSPSFIDDLYPPNPDAELFEKQKRKHRTTEWNCLHWIKVVSMFIVATVAAVIVITYFFHLVAPDRWCWLSEGKLEDLKNTAISVLTGLGVGIALTLLHDT